MDHITIQPTKYLKVGMATGEEGIWQRIIKGHFGSAGVLHNKWLKRDEILIDLLNKIEGYQYDFGNNRKDRQKFLRTYCYFNIILFPNPSERLIKEKDIKPERNDNKLKINPRKITNLNGTEECFIIASIAISYRVKKLFLDSNQIQLFILRQNPMWTALSKLRWILFILIY